MSSDKRSVPSHKAKEGKAAKVVIGWSEPVDFPDWDISGLNAKIDTGARTSALHVENVKYLVNDFVRFDVVLSRKSEHRRKHVTAQISRWGKVRSSSGHFSSRPFVKTTIRLGPVEKEIELSLVSRERMIYRMLLGRKALEKDFLVDASRRKIHGKRKKPRKKKVNKKKSSP